MKTRLSILMVFAVLAALFSASGARADGPVTGGIVGAGEWHTCALMPSGAVDCWGENSDGQAEDQPGPYTQVSAGPYHTCALTPSGAVDCWGYNVYGEAVDQPGPYTQVSAGGFHNCGLTPSGAVDCWGDNPFGQAEDQASPYTEVSIGGYHSCALTPSGAVDCWGYNIYGQSEDQPGPYGPYVPSGDTTPPVVAVTGVSDGAAYTLGAVPQAGCSTTDADSGVATEATLSLSGGTALGVGSFTATCSGAVDNAGNQADAVSVSYTVAFLFTGFTAPVDNPDVLNIAKAGQAIPLKWRLTDAAGNPVTGLTEVGVSVVALACEQGETPDPIEEYVQGDSGLQNLGDGYYQWNWKTPKGYAGLCKTLTLDLGEGAGYEHPALFRFR